MTKEEKEIIEKINQSLQNMKDEINAVKYTRGSFSVRLKFGSALPKIQKFNPPVQNVLAEFIERKPNIRVRRSTPK